MTNNAITYHAVIYILMPVLRSETPCCVGPLTNWLLIGQSGWWHSPTWMAGWVLYAGDSTWACYMGNPMPQIDF